MMPWKTATMKEQRIQFVAQALVPGVNFSALCQRFGISRPTGYRWVQRYHEVQTFTQLKEYSRRPVHSPGRTAQALEEQVEALWHQHGWGARKLAYLLAQQGVHLPATTVHRILRRRGCVQTQQTQSVVRQRFERSQPNELWQMDFKGEFTWGTKQKCYPLSLLDDHSRYLVGLTGLPCQQGVEVWNILTDIFRNYGVPQAILMDHGSPWWGSLNGHGLTLIAVKLIQQGIQLYYSGIRHPQTQGKVERFHRTLAESVRHHGKPQTWPAWHQFLDSFRHEYNYVRPHESIGMQPPSNRYQRSQQPYHPRPVPWVYPEPWQVKTLDSKGCLIYQNQRYFVCEALAKEEIGYLPARDRVLVRFRHMLVRDIDILTGCTLPLILPEQSINL